MLLNTDYKLLGSIPDYIFSDLKEIAQTIDWSKNEFQRQEKLCTRIVRVPYGVRQEQPQELTHDVQKILQGFESIDNWMHSQYSTHVFIKCEIACLMPGDELFWHVDPNWWHQHSHRVHIPIITNPHCFWCIEDREHYFEVGKYYEVNNRRYHTYCNRGNTFRLHLVFDILDKSIYQSAIKNQIDISGPTRKTELLTRQDFFIRLPQLLKEEYF